MLLSKGTEVLLVAPGRVGGQGPLGVRHGAAAGHVSLGAETEQGEALGMLFCPGNVLPPPQQRVFGKGMVWFACTLLQKRLSGSRPVPGAVGCINVKSQPHLTPASAEGINIVT